MGERRYPLGDNDVVRFGYDDYRYGCLCTFPHNYSSKSFGIDETQSLALLGATLCLYNNSPNLLKKEDWMGNEYVIPDCLPEWVRDNIRNSLCNYPEKFDKDEYDVDHVPASISDEEYKTLRIKRLKHIIEWCETEIKEIENEEIKDYDTETSEEE